jgi:hypothetical protein
MSNENRYECISVMSAAVTLQGGCHCGRLRVAFSTGVDPAGMQPRACDCSFCQKHGAAYVSDPAGQLSISVAEPDDMRRYRQGSNTAEFLFCGHCGVLVAVVFERDGRTYGAVNARCLDATACLGNAVTASPQQLAVGDKVDRWLRLWIPDVELVVDGSTPTNAVTRLDRP